MALLQQSNPTASTPFDPSTSPHYDPKIARVHPALTAAEFAAVCKARAERHLMFVQYGVDMGWWKVVDEKGDLIPNDIKVSLAELPSGQSSMAHVFFKHGLFTSVNQARKAGWNKPFEPGTYYFKKSRQTFILTE